MARFNYRCFLKLLLCVPAILLYGCATYKPAENVQTLYDRVSKEVSGGLSVTSNEFQAQCFPMIDDKVAKTNLGIVPVEFGVLPVFLKVENMSQNPVKVDLPNSFITIGQKETVYMDIDSVVQRIARKDGNASIAFGIIFGLAGGALGSAVGGAVGIAIDNSIGGSETVEGHYYRQVFSPTFVQPKSSGAGLVFYQFSKEDLKCEGLTLAVPIVNLNTNNISNVKFNFKPANYRTVKEDEE